MQCKPEAQVKSRAVVVWCVCKGETELGADG